MKRKIKVTMVSKAASVMDYNARVARGEGTQVEVVIEKTIRLSFTNYTIFGARLLDEQNFIRNNQDLMKVDEDGVWHVIRVTCKDTNLSILVNAEGYDYARYSATIRK